MKRILVFLSVLNIIGCVESGEYSMKKEILSDEEKIEKRRVEQIKSKIQYRITLSNEFGKIKSDTTLIEEERYNDNGVLIFHFMNNYTENELFETRISKYHDTGLLKYKYDSMSYETLGGNYVTEVGDKRITLRTKVTKTRFNEGGKLVGSTSLLNSEYLSRVKSEWINDTVQIYKSYDSFGDLISHEKSVYNRNGDILETTYFDNGEIDVLRTYRYDKKSNKIEYYQYSDYRVWKEEYVYDSNNNEVERISYSSTPNLVLDGQLNPEYVYNSVEESLRNEKELFITERYTFEFDELGNPTETSKYSLDGSYKFHEISEYIYDENNNILEEETISEYKGKEDITYSYFHTYDPSGNKIETVSKKDGKLKSRREYIYGSIGNLIELVKYDNNNDVETIKRYLYNDLGFEISYKVFDENENMKYQIFTEYR